jgi:hypothetical protein
MAADWEPLADRKGVLPEFEQLKHDPIETVRAASSWAADVCEAESACAREWPTEADATFTVISTVTEVAGRGSVNVESCSAAADATPFWSLTPLAGGESCRLSAAFPVLLSADAVSEHVPFGDAQAEEYESEPYGALTV